MTSCCARYVTSGSLMATYSELREHVLDLLWSQWHELGVAATVPRRHSDDCIDLEPLIVFTAVHGDMDARLRDESIDWVLQYGSYVSKARLKNVLGDWDLRDDAQFQDYAATVNAHGGKGWPAGNGKSFAFRSRARSLLADLQRPALLALRIRAIFGVGARAELIRVFLSHPELAMTAADLSAETNYGKRNVLNELEPLRFVGLIRSFRAVNADRFSLAAKDRIETLVGPIPQRFTKWPHTFAVLHLVLGLARRGAKRHDLENAVEAVRLLEAHKQHFASAEIYAPQLPAGVSAWPEFLEWATHLTRSIARPGPD